jgi:hypothetical protein
MDKEKKFKGKVPPKKGPGNDKGSMKSKGKDKGFVPFFAKGKTKKGK